VEIAPEKSQLWSNLGWMQMIAGNIREARVSLEKALSLKPGDKIVEGNLRIHSYLARHGGNYFDYLLRPLDRNKIDKLATAEKWEEAEALCSDYNSCRIEAMAREILLNGGKDISFLPDTLSTLRCFFGFAGELNIEGCFLQEDLSFIASNFKSIMHKFIFKFADVDCGMIKEIYDALFRYYGFLAARGIVPAGNFRAFQKDALGIKAELIAKMEKYNVIRHADMPEKKRESLRGELFEDDHLYPHL